jgi:hypothetical protein
MTIKKLIGLIALFTMLSAFNANFYCDDPVTEPADPPDSTDPADTTDPADPVTPTDPADSGGSNGSGGPSSELIGNTMHTVGHFINICTHWYKVTNGGDVLCYYGLSRYSASVNNVEAMAGLVNDLMSGLQGMGNATEAGSEAGNTMGSVGAGLKNFGEGLQKAAQNAEQAWLQRNMLSGGIRDGDMVPAPAILPSNFKPFMRTATRRFANIDEYFKQVPQIEDADHRQVFLDGNLWLDELKFDKPLIYHGVGTIASAYVPQSTIFTGVEAAEVMSIQPGNNFGSNHLNLFYLNADNPGTGEGMLTIQGDVKASVYSYQGVKPKGMATIDGNLVTNLINKSRFGAGNDLLVAYDTQYMQEESGDDDPYRWVTISVSPKISGIGEQLQRVEGDGDDGVANILDSLDAPPVLPAQPAQPAVEDLN